MFTDEVKGEENNVGTRCEGCVDCNCDGSGGCDCNVPSVLVETEDTEVSVIEEGTCAGGFCSVEEVTEVVSFEPTNDEKIIILENQISRIETELADMQMMQKSVDFIRSHFTNSFAVYNDIDITEARRTVEGVLNNIEVSDNETGMVSTVPAYLESYMEQYKNKCKLEGRLEYHKLIRDGE
jgi:hypothetical protein